MGIVWDAVEAVMFHGAFLLSTCIFISDVSGECNLYARCGMNNFIRPHKSINQSSPLSWPQRDCNI